MRMPPPGLLVAAALSLAAACMLDSAGLGGNAGRVAVLVPDGGTGATGMAGALATTGDAAASAGVGGLAGDAGGAGRESGGATGSGAAGEGAAGEGAAGDTGAAGAGAGAAVGGAAGSSGSVDASGAAGTTPVDAGMVSPIGCADGTREGFTSLQKYPDLAACAGGWQIAGLVGAATRTPQCHRNGGNDGAQPEGAGCSVADLCADGWHICESAREVSAKTADCKDAFVDGHGPAFYATRQRGPMMACDPANQTGTNNIYGCGTFGSAAAAACAPFTRMLRDADCKANPPWTCVNGPVDYSVSELADVTKPGPAKGGVLCCR